MNECLWEAFPHIPFVPQQEENARFCAEAEEGLLEGCWFFSCPPLLVTCRVEFLPLYMLQQQSFNLLCAWDGDRCVETSKSFPHLYTRHVKSISASMWNYLQAVFCVLTHEETAFTADAKSSTDVVIFLDNPWPEDSVLCGGTKTRVRRLKEIWQTRANRAGGGRLYP